MDLSRDSNKKNRVKWILRAFIVLGIVLTFHIFGYSCIRMLMAGNWAQADCKILESSVIQTLNRSNVSTKIKISYEYTFNDQIFQNDIYGFFESLNRTVKSARAAVSKYPKGSTQICYVNPKKPSEAVLQRDFEMRNLLGLVPLVFTAAGFLGLWTRRKEGQTISRPSDFANQEVELKPRSRFAKAVLISFVTLIFCVSSILLWQQKIFYMAPIFGFVSILLIAVSLNTIMAIFNPRVHLRLTPSAVEIGKAGALSWVITGRIKRLQKFTILLESRKTTSDRKKRNTVKLHSDELLTTTNLSEMVNGEIGFVIDSDKPATLKGFDNSILWYVVVKGSIKWWPDIEDEFEFDVFKD